MFSRMRKVIKLHFYNKRNGSGIKSCDVSLRAFLGFGLRVGRGSFIDSNCRLGKYCYVGRNCNITKSLIGAYCSIANNVSIGQGEHSLSRVSTSSVFYDLSYDELTTKDCVIGNDVWIGSDAIILRGVRIGDGAVVGANAVVTKDVKAFEVVAGVPARHLKFRFPEEQQAAILDSAWWNLELAEAREAIQRLELK